MERRNIQFSPPDITDLERNEVMEVLKSGWITTAGKTKQFESKIAEYIGTSKAVCLNSDTAALEMTLRILGVGAGDEVITTAYTYTASASVIEHVGAKIVMIDTGKDSFEMDYDKIADAITPKTKVIIPVDIGGRICNYEKIYQAIEERKELFIPSNDLQKAYGRVIVLSDSAHGFGGRKIAGGKEYISGQLADFTCFSFHAVKNLTTGEGGAVTWRNHDGVDNDGLYREYMLMSLHGQSKDAFAKAQLGAWEYDILYPAYKCNMTDIMAAIGLKQLERYPELLQKRKKYIKMYDDVLQPLGVDTLQHYDNENISSGHLYLVRIPGIQVEQRNDIIIKMAEAGIATNVHYKPLPMMTAYKRLGFDISNYPNAYEQYENEITLPLHTCLTEDDVQYVANVLKSILIENGLVK